MEIEPGEAKALSDIDTYGCHIIHVFEDEETPRFSYSVGIEKTSGQPELIVTGLRRELAHWIINEYNRRVRKGEVFQQDTPYFGFLEGHYVTFKLMSKDYYSKYLGWDLWLYGGPNFRVLQMIWPSTGGKWPWDADAPADYKGSIPLLFEPVKFALLRQLRPLKRLVGHEKAAPK
ncbi:DUF4262 domain-containing protein [Marivivens marinus]|uniref:DUF4262 domain-containing protein n=1 Tax=Marivivens marinus TaxID=3110173 RepID=UPI003B8462F7